MNPEQLIMQFEGFHAEPYWDVKQWSIGYGTNADPGNTDRNNRPNVTVTRQQATEALRAETSNLSSKIDSYDSVYNFTPEQRAALTSFGYNLGPASIDQLTDGGTRTIDEVTDTMLLYRNAGGSVSSGLEARRAVERYVANGGTIPPGTDVYQFGRNLVNGEDHQVALHNARGNGGSSTGSVGEVVSTPSNASSFQGADARQLSLSDLTDIRENNSWAENSLNDYDFYTYNLEYFIVGQEDANNFFTNVSLQDISSGSWPLETTKKVIIASTGRTAEFNIDGLSVETSTGSSNAEVTSGASTRLNFTLTQVGEVSIGETLKAATAIGGWNSISHAMMFISIKFVGWINDVPTTIPNSSKVIPFRLSKVDNITTEVSESGTTLVVEGMTINRSAMSSHVDTIKEAINVEKGLTVKDSLQNLQDALNLSVSEAAVVSDSKYGLVYNILPIDDSLAAELINNNKVNYDGSSNNNARNNTVSATNSGASMKTATDTYVLAAGSSIHDVIKEILIQSETIKAELTTPNNNFTRVPVVRVEYIPTVGGYNPLTNNEGATVTYYIDVVEEMIDQNSIDLGRKALNSGNILDSLMNANRLKKKYENSYTGMNTDVIMFNVSLEKQLIKTFNSATDSYFDVTSLIDQGAALDQLNDAAQVRLSDLRSEIDNVRPQLERTTSDRDSMRESLARTNAALKSDVSRELTASGIDEDTANQISALSLEQLMSVASGGGLSNAEGEDLGQTSIIKDVLARINLDERFDIINAKNAILGRATESVSQFSSVLDSARSESANILQSGVGAALSESFNVSRANINTNFNNLNIGNQTSVLIEELGSDIRSRLTSTDAERMLYAISENPVTFNEVTEEWLRSNTELSGIKGADVNSTVFSRLKYNEGHQGSLSMIQASMVIKGDPFWLESYASPKTRAEVYGRDKNFSSSLPNDSTKNSGRNFVLVVENALADVDQFDNQNISNLFTWVYMVKDVTSTFVDGIFSQELNMVKFQYLDGMERDVRDNVAVVDEEE